MPAWEVFETQPVPTGFALREHLLFRCWLQEDCMRTFAIYFPALDRISGPVRPGARVATGVALFGLAACLSLPAQTPAPPATQPIRPVTTTIEVQGHVSDDYLPTALSVGSLDGLPLLQAPVSATVVTRDLMTDQFTRVLSDVVKNDASIGEDYAPVGYYGDFEIRGFPIDLATGLQINGMVISGEQDVPLENKERGTGRVSQRHCRPGEWHYYRGRLDQLCDQATSAGEDV
jgi:hypothetical protein